MNAYIFQAALWCESCTEKLMAEIPKPAGMDPRNEYSWDSDDYPKGPYPDGGGEADCPQHCDACGMFLENPLTRDGVEYVRQAWDWHPWRGGSTIIRQWEDFYRAELTESAS